MPFTTMLTPSQLHSSPLQLHHLTLSPANLHYHNTSLNAGLAGGAGGGGGGAVGGQEMMGQNLLPPQSSVSELTSVLDTQESHEILSEASKISDDLPFR